MPKSREEILSFVQKQYNELPEGELRQALFNHMVSTARTMGWAYTESWLMSTPEGKEAREELRLQSWRAWAKQVFGNYLLDVYSYRDGESPMVSIKIAAGHDGRTLEFEYGLYETIEI